MKKFLSFMLFLIIVLGAILFVGRNQIVKMAIEKGARKAFDLEVAVSKVDIDFKDTLIAINDLKIMNQQGYEDSLMFDMPEIQVNYHLRDIIGGKIHFEELRLNISELVAIRNRDGDLNLSVFQPKSTTSQKDSSTSSSDSGKKEEASPKELNLQIDSATIKLGKLIFKDYTHGETPEVKEVNVNLDETFENVSDLQSMITLIVQKALMKSAFPGLEADFGALMEGLPEEAGGILNTLKDKIKLPSF